MKSQKFILLALLGVLLLVACSGQSEFKSLIKNDIKKSFLTEAKNLSDANPVDDWWLEFNDELLNRLIDLGLKNNKDILIANAQIITARELNNIKVATLLPSASFGVGRQRFSSPGFGPNGAKYDIYQSTFDAAWELDFFGKNLDRAKAGKLRFLKEVQLYKVLTLRIASEIAKNYIELRSSEKQITNLKEIISIREKLSAIAAQKEKNGAASKTEIYNAEINSNAALAQISELETAAKISTYRLAVLVGTTPDQIGEILKNSDLSKIITYQSGVVPIGLKSDILRRRPDIIAAEYEIDAAVFDKNAQAKEFFPSFNLTAKIGGGAKNLGDVFKDGANVKNINGFVSVPIFEGGRLIAEYKISKAKAKIAVLDYENTVLKALEECESELVRYINSLQIESAFKKQLDSSAGIFKISQNKKRFGAISSEEFLGAKIALLNMENQFLGKKSQSLINLISLHKAIGGGFEGYKIKFEKNQILWIKENEKL